MDQVHWSVWVSLAVTVALLAWFVRPPPGKDRFQSVDELEISAGDALGVLVVLGAVGLAVWLGYYVVKMVFLS